MKKIKKFGSLLMAVVIMFSCMAVNVSAATNNTKEVNTGEVVFNTTEEYQQYEGVDKEGNPFTISVEKVNSPSLARASSTRWNVSFTGILINCNFYMTVSGNKCTKVEDYKIICIGNTYQNVSLTKTSTYGKLAFDSVAYLNLLSGRCWLKGIVTGSKNDITVSYSM